MGCQLSNPEEICEIDLEHDLPPTVISSLNASTIASLPSSHYKQKHSIYTHSKYLKLKSFVTTSLENLSNFQDLMKILDHWEDLVLKKTEELVQVSELSFSINESTKPEVLIALQVDGLRKFDFLQKFLKRLKEICRFSGLSPDVIKENEEFIQDLTPLTVHFYLLLGKDVDFGIGVNKAIDRKNLSRFLQHSADRKTLTQWSYAGIMPIPVSMNFSLVKKARSCSFYIFDGEKDQNYSKAFAIFEYLGAPVEENVLKAFWAAKSAETCCKVWLESEKIVEVAVEVDQLPWEEYLTIAELLAVEVRSKQTNYSQKVALQLDKHGLNLVKYSDI